MRYGDFTMSVTVSKALTELGITEWSIHGDPTNETEFNAMFRKIIGTDDIGSAIESSDTTQFGVTWQQISDKIDELNASEPINLLREERNLKIAETDWWASSDLTMSVERAAYRQALRDITETYTSLDDVVWPEKPE